MKAAPGLSAFVLHAYDWSESSLVLEVFTREQGRLAVIAKGAKRPTSQLRAVLLPLQRLHLQLTKAKAEGEDAVHTLRHADWVADHPLPTGPALLAGYYLNELLLRLLPRAEPQAPLWQAYAQSVLGLARAPLSAEPWLRAFELALLGELGWLPALDADSVTQAPLREAQCYTLSPELGLMAADEGPRGASWRALHGCALPERAEWLAQAAPAERSALKTELRRVLQQHLGPQRLRSREVLHQAQGLALRELPRPV